MLMAARGGRNGDQADRHGLFRLHPRPDDLYNPADCHADIVAIHGLGGHPLKTWRSEDDRIWLRDSLPAHVPNTRVMAFGYDSAVRFANLGGVVSKEFLIHLSLQLDRGRELLDSVFGVVFMGTPHRGSRVATPAKLLANIINVATLGTHTADRVHETSYNRSL
ncbi:ankyrin repeats (3 copies) domain-containing protein [Purpureocillium lavendulum]|uniref:Ankyrin repeats (3 copies) domain-containing protein n=1 Tax=Purpureocillium lavendulum TaxID=1247861 RepID=A0AB34FVV5_9HYPO|nr:ankyrin repeats (3 copies) domain-containing protein [Purpureocillium lavendulum]